jgi:hypothetical protein
MGVIDSLKANAEAARQERRTEETIGRLRAYTYFSDKPEQKDKDAAVKDLVKLRRSGKSTRLVDKYIQELFAVGWAHVVDSPFDNNECSNKFLMDWVERRMKVEHQFVEYKIKDEHIFLT